VNVGYFPKCERKSCVCGQKPLQQVFHLRHEGTGAMVDIGSSCAGRFKLLGDLVQREAEQALKNLKELKEDPQRRAEEALLKFARDNGVITTEEKALLLKSELDHKQYVKELKAVIVVGLDLARRTDAEITAQFREPRRSQKGPQSRGPTPHERRALLRLALLKPNGRKQLLMLLDLKNRGVSDDELHLGSGPLLGGRSTVLETELVPDKGSMVALLVARGAVRDARTLLEACRWRGLHAKAALVAAVRCKQDDFVAEYCARRRVEPPHANAALLAIQQSVKKGARTLELLLSFKGRLNKHGFLDAALATACEGAPVEVIEQLLEAGANDKQCKALLKWCARLSGDRRSWASAAQVAGQEQGRAIAERLLGVGMRGRVASARQHERTALHFAAASGDASLVGLLLDCGCSPWSTTTAPSKQEVQDHMAIAERRLPLEVAQKAECDTVEAEKLLKEKMTEDLRVVLGDEYASAFSQEELDKLRKRMGGNDDDMANSKLLQRFETFTHLMRTDPDAARAQARAQAEKKQRKAREAEEARIFAEAHARAKRECLELRSAEAAKRVEVARARAGIVKELRKRARARMEEVDRFRQKRSRTGEPGSGVNLARGTQILVMA
jgi:ankyrin repeat protein